MQTCQVFNTLNTDTGRMNKPPTKGDALVASCLMPWLFTGHCEYKPSTAHAAFGGLGCFVFFFLEIL